MASQQDILLRVRKTLEGIDGSSPDTAQQPTLNDQLEQYTAAGASPYEEITRSGRSFHVRNTVAVAAVVAFPTTTANLQLYNNEPENGRSYVIDYLYFANVVSTAVVAHAQMLALIGQVRETAPTDAALVIQQLNGVGKKDTVARTVLTGTALPATTGIAGLWMAVGPQAIKTDAVATPGYGAGFEVNGRIVVPPGRFFATQVLANVVGETFITGIMWHERQLRLA